MAASSASFGTRSRLHNFGDILPKWGKQRYFRCVKKVADQPRPALAVAAVKKYELKSVNLRLKLTLIRPPLEAEKKVEGDQVSTSLIFGPEIAKIKEKRYEDSPAGASEIKDDGGGEKQRRRRATKRAEKVRFRVGLSRREVEEDFLKICKAGCKQSSRPKKRPKKVHETFDWLCPGTTLKEITVDQYKI